MRILHVAPLWFPVARSSSGGIETFLAALIDEQVRTGCDVTLIASGDSETSASLVEAAPTGAVDAMAAGRAYEYTYFEQRALALALELESEFDAVHCHLGPAAFALSAGERLRNRLLHTHHNEITPDLVEYVGRHPDLWVSTPSSVTAGPLRRAGARRCAVVPNGIDPADFAVGTDPGRGLAFLGRMEWAKGADVAIEVGRATGRPLTLAGPIVDDEFFDTTIEPALGESVRYAGVLDHIEKCMLLASSACTLVPSRCEEGFGMVAVESMACGTPVIGSGRGALAEVVEDGITGFTADGRTMAARVDDALALDRRTVATRARERFSVSRSAASYLSLYERALIPTDA
jgi:glycosyltransferase involved in cell wall biosynthesis